MHKLSILLSFFIGTFLLITPSFLFANLTVEPITWNVVGLDSNNVNEGPNRFPVGLRVTNTGAVTATNVEGNFVWLTANPYISLFSPATSSVSSIDPGEFRDLYFSVQIQRTTLAWETSRQYRIDVTSNEYPPVSSPPNREIYVERLFISQHRNEILSFTGPDQLFVGQDATFTLIATTASSYDQLTVWSLFPLSDFDIISTYVTATNPPGFTADRLYMDACGWIADLTDPNYLSCANGNRVGGDLTVLLTVRPKVVGTYTVDHLIYDLTGASVHYNSSFQSGTVVFNPGSIGDLVWEDADFDGLYNPVFDGPIPGVKMNLRGRGPDNVFGTADDKVFPFTTTNGIGNYQFLPLSPDVYQVSVDITTLPGGMLPVLGNTNVQEVTLLEGQNFLDADFGYYRQELLVGLTSFQAVAPAEGMPIEISWETSAEVDNAGFNVYRTSQTSTGLEPGVRVNPSMIPAQGNETGGAFYSVFDSRDDVTRTTQTADFYFLEDVSFGGASNFHGPIPVVIGQPYITDDLKTNILDWRTFE